MFPPLFKIARVRFALYVAGTFWIGRIAGIVRPAMVENVMDVVMLAYENWFSLLSLAYFLFPANLLIYGANDLADGDTDALNDKKGTYEHKLLGSQKMSVVVSILAWNLPYLVLFFWYVIALPDDQRQQKILLAVSYILFLFTSLFYSLPPIRAKAKPFLDGTFNILYILPGAISFFLHYQTAFDWRFFVAGWIWCMAMHAYSAIPDITPDKQAGLTTTAVFLGKEYTGRYCGILFVIAGLVAGFARHRFLIVLGLFYGMFAVWSVYRPSFFRYYTWFPWINSTLGFVLFWLIFIQKVMG